MADIYQKLQAYGESDFYPYHMPGHKRRLYGDMSPTYMRNDITEIDGFDNLHQPEGIIMEAQKKAARLCKAEESFFLVNGSTAGILSAVSAAVSLGGSLLMARNCHKAAYHVAYIRQLSLHYLYPEKNNDFDIYEPVTAEQVEKALGSYPQVEAVLIVSPTYEGRVADVEAIAKVVHAHDKILIVDEAHGAHLGFAEGFAKNSNMAGADLVIQSVHKTLPAPTQSAILHVNGERVDRERLQRFLHIYQTSSPSYLLMAGIENAMEIVEKDGKELFQSFYQWYDEMIQKLGECRKLRFLTESAQAVCQDVGKLVIDTSKTKISGQELYQLLLEKYHLQMEMAGRQYCLAMFTVGDTKEGYDRLTEALLEIDKSLSDTEDDKVDSEKELSRYETIAVQGGIQSKEEIMPLFIAWDREQESVLLSEALGRKSAEFINLYPPGIPILVPGECFTKETIDDLQRCVTRNMNVQGVLVKEKDLLVKCIKE